MKVSAEIPKERIFDVMKEISKVQVIEPLGTGDIVIENVHLSDSLMKLSYNIHRYMKEQEKA